MLVDMNKTATYLLNLKKIKLSCLEQVLFVKKNVLRLGFRVLTLGMHMSRNLCYSADCQLPAMEGHTLLCCV